MSNNPIYIGDKEAFFNKSDVKGELITFENESYYKISNSAAMRPFFISLTSPSNHWMFISSNGGLSAGRKNAEQALFPYYTDDKITESVEVTGSKTIVQVHKKDKTFLWEPFSNKYEGVYNITRNLYKNGYGNKIIFEEINTNLGLSFRYQWNSSDRFGFVKKSSLINNTYEKIEVTVLDGIQNIMPCGVGSDLQNACSNLVDAYKKSELETDSGLGIYALSAIIVDKAEPSEALKANIVWSLGMEQPKHLISSLQLTAFRRGESISQETDIKAEKGAYFICSEISLTPQGKKDWILVANVNQSRNAICEISEKIKNETNLATQVQDDIDSGTKQLLELTSAADGMQLSANALRNTRHFANSLFNIMRGGIFDHNYTIEKEDFISYLANANKNVWNNKQERLSQLESVFNLKTLKSIALKDDDGDFKRLCFEYLLLKFSRRHGDPSRPWNKFSINTKSEVDGTKILDYEGNWRDIFQNWEALAHGYPEFLESMIHKFLNATTFDGYNPYRVTKRGFDWEIIEENDPWSYIGYWGDHQIIYLLKFLERLEDHYPGTLSSYFKQNLFVYANVPYKIKSYEDILKDPKDTIDFDAELDAEINIERNKIGADGALLKNNKSLIHKVNLIEKLLATVLAKMSNFIPEAGIWLNTQRPEWNDANNALVGNGVSMVTLYYLRRFLSFFESLVSKSTSEYFEISIELSNCFKAVLETLNSNKDILDTRFSDKDRKTVLDGLANAGSNYRNCIYNNGFTSVKEGVSNIELLQFLALSKKYLEHTIAANKREDKLYHSYNLMTLTNPSEIAISYLPEMLEGQVAVLSSGCVSGASAVEVLNALKSSALFRPNQYSYLLYPNKNLPRFVAKNNIPAQAVEKSKLLQQLLKAGNTQVIEKDILGNFHFNGNFNNANSLKDALSNLPKAQYGLNTNAETEQLLDLFENVFNHKAFTGRSGTFFGYEGLGSIYWHMVSKLMLSVQEVALLAFENNESEVVIGQLLDHYYKINEGIGVQKTPQLYGAFPTDPYSHTPAGKGAQQPGMTGQVKEDVLSRFGELGVCVKNGLLQFSPKLLRRQEFLDSAKTFKYNSVNKEECSLVIEKGMLCFTYCQIPIIYKQTTKNGIKVVFNNLSILEFPTLSLDLETSKHVFERSGAIDQIIVSLKK